LDSGSYFALEYQSLREGDKIFNYLIGEVEDTGNKIILAIPADDSVYSPSETVNFIVLVKNASKNLMENKTVDIRLLNSLGTVLDTSSGKTNSSGYFLDSFNAPSNPGIYTISLNDSIGVEVFAVEAFNLMGMITDLDGNPSHSFAPNPVVRINLISKNPSGDPFDLDSAYFVLSYPNGSILNMNLVKTSTGVYSYDRDLDSAPNGDYGVRIVGVSSGDQQEFYTGFAIEAVRFEAMAMNHEFMEQMEGPGGEVSAFAPQKNITIMALLMNISAGGMFSKEGPAGMIDIDNESTPDVDECGTLVELLDLRDERDISHLAEISYMVKNLTSAMLYFGDDPSDPEEAPPPQMQRQCMIIIDSGLNKTGMYNAKIKVSHPLGDKVTGVNFEVQKLMARGSTVDFKGEDFAFFSPGNIVRIKLKVIDLSTREELNATSILDAKIIKMRREFPGFKEIDIQANISNESVSNGTIEFVAPGEEGFYSMKFRFKANLSGVIEEGIGDAFFALKKYIIFAHMECEGNGGDGGGKCLAGVGQNITLKVNVIDIDKGSMLDLDMQTGLTCTGCEGLIADVKSLWNDQLMKEISDTDYDVVQGSVINSTATVKINPVGSGLPTGWYGVDLELEDKVNNKTYFGWGGFEIRNFWVETVYVENKSGNLTIMFREPAYEKGKPVLFALIPRDPHNPENILPISGTPTIESVKWMMSRPPLDVSFTGNVTDETVYSEWGPPSPSTMKVVKIEGLDKEGYYQANVKVTVSGIGTDIGTMWFDLSSYEVRKEFRGMEDWPPTFSSSENMSIKFIGCEFGPGCTPHNLSQSGTKLYSVFDEKSDMPKKLPSVTVCPPQSNVCIVNVSLAGLLPRRYYADFEINDSNGVIKETGIEFEIKELYVGIPSMEEAHTRYQDTKEKELEFRNDRDRCYNQLWLNDDEYSSWDTVWFLDDETAYGVGLMQDGCNYDDTKICLAGGLKNITFGSAVTGTLWGVPMCVYGNGSLHQGDPEPCQDAGGRLVVVASNETHIWFNTSNANSATTDIFDMIGIPPNVTGDKVDTGNRIWTIDSINQSCWGVDSCFEFTDDLLFFKCVGPECDPNGTDSTTMILSGKYNVNKGGIYCVVGSVWQPNVLEADCVGGDSVWVFSNSTHAWINDTTPQLNETSPITKGTVDIGGTEWYVIDVGKDVNGEDDEEKIRIAPGNTKNIISINGESINITVSEKYSKNYGNKFCIGLQGEWHQTYQDCVNETTVYVVSNSTAIWVNETGNLNTSEPLVNGSVFYNFSSRNWSVVSVSDANDERMVAVRHADGRICGEAEMNCGPQGCDQIQYSLKPANSDYTEIYHGYRDLIQDEWIGEELGINNSKPVYIYHNTTNLFMSKDLDFTGEMGKRINEIITDPYGGEWKVKKLTKRVVELTGVNVLSGSGIYINTNLSKSGTILIGKIEEEYLGKWGKEGASGLDLNGDGLKNTSLVFALSDNVTKSIYDTFFYSLDENFTNTSQIIPIDSNKATRTFGFNDTVTLLSIDASANRIKLYSKEKGDWGELGEFKIGSKIKIPIIVRTPAGQPTTANVSIHWLKIKDEQGTQFVELTSTIPNKSISDIDEIEINLTELGYPSAGEYIFSVEAKKDGDVEKLDEWKWPRATMRAFLVDSHTGDAHYVSSFKELPTLRFDWENYGEVARIRADRRNESNIVEGILTHADPFGFGPEECVPPSMCAANWSNCTLLRDHEEDRYYLYSHDDQLLYSNDTSCNFTGSETNYTEGDSLLLDVQGKTYNLTVLRIDIYDESGCGGPCYRASFGVPGVNSSVIKPMRNDTNNQEWGIEWGYMPNVSIWGVYYDIILAGGTQNYPMCDNWEMEECAKVAWFDTDGNFSNAVSAAMGESFATDLYLAKIGPGPWEGLIIANHSVIGSRPLVDVRQRDNTNSYFKVFKETEMGVDFNMDGAINKTFYAVLFDDRDDGEQNLTNILVDDDLQITEDWWRNESIGQPAFSDYYDFNSTELGSTRENWGNLPIGIWSGNIRFDEWIENASWEEQPEWRILEFNVTDALLVKDKWEIKEDENVTFLLRAYDFDQTPKQNTVLSVKSVMLCGMFGSNLLQEGAGYTITNVKNVTGPDGYGILKINHPADKWSEGDYMVRIEANYTGSVEIVNSWFRVGEEKWK